MMCKFYQKFFENSGHSSAQGLGLFGDQTKRADHHKVPEESTTKKQGHSTDFKNWGHPRHLPLDRNSQICLIS